MINYILTIFIDSIMILLIMIITHTLFIIVYRYILYYY